MITRNYIQEHQPHPREGGLLFVYQEILSLGDMLDSANIFINHKLALDSWSRMCQNDNNHSYCCLRHVVTYSGTLYSDMNKCPG